MIFLGIISWKGASCFNVGWGVVLQMGGGSFLSGGGGGCPMGGIGFDGGEFKKNCRMGGGGGEKIKIKN